MQIHVCSTTCSSCYINKNNNIVTTIGGRLCLVLDNELNICVYIRFIGVKYSSEFIFIFK